MPEKTSEISHDMDVEKEVVNADNEYEIIMALEEGKTVVCCVTNDVYATFEPDGRVIVDDKELNLPEYEHKMGDKDNSVNAFITNLRQTIETVKKARMAIPEEYFKNFGGIKGIAKNIMTANRIETYIEKYDKLSSEKQDHFRKNYSNFSKEQGGQE